MKIVIVSCLLAVAFAAPKPQDDRDRSAVITRDERVDQGDGNFRYDFAADNGLEMSVQGEPGSQGQSNMQGSYLLPLADGGFALVSFIANENGFQPQSEILPVGPPAPAHVAELLRIADEQRAAGITFE